VSPPELSAILANEPYVSEVAVAGVPAASVWIGEEAWAWIVKNGDISDEEVARRAKEAISRRLARHKWLANVVVVDKLPKTSTSKVFTKDLVAAAKEEVAKTKRATCDFS
jgi:acyl-CoA synthetase (AMP-forming)/AMP-acid ligase II